VSSSRRSARVSLTLPHPPPDSPPIHLPSLLPPIRSNHLHYHQQRLYENVHNFLGRISLCIADGASTTWLELKLTFDFSGLRDRDCERPSLPHHTLADDLANFKSIVHYIVRTSGAHSMWQDVFRVVPQTVICSLSQFALSGHQAAFGARILHVPDTAARLACAIIKLRKGTSPRYSIDMALANFQGTSEHTFNLPFRPIASQAWDAAGTSLNSHPAPLRAAEAPSYGRSRIIYCKLCGHPHQCAHLALWTGRGIASFYCRGCKRTSHASGAKCECNFLWYTCSTHRVDPLILHAPPPQQDQLSPPPAASTSTQSSVPVALFPHRPAPAMRSSTSIMRNPNHASPQPIRISPIIAPTLAARFPHLAKP